MDDVIVAELIVHVGLCASALAAWLQDVDASTLGGYDKSKDSLVTLLNLKNGVLTADVDRAAEGLGDLRVELNHEVSLVRELVVALLDCRGDPLPERLADDRVDHVDDPLPRQLSQVALVGQVRRDLFEGPALLEDVLDREAGVERDVQVLGCF